MRHIAPLAGLLAVLGLAACSSSFGAGGDPPPAKVIVVPQGQACPGGGAAPCQ